MDKGGEEGLDFILSHFPTEESIFPRTISTKATDKKQKIMYSKEEALARFKQAGWQDCRISAYPSYTGYKGINRQAPNFIFIDEDRSTFKTNKAHNKAFATTLENIEQILGGHPTVLWSGNGYHIYQPIEAILFEQQDIFAKFEKPSRRFMQFAESFLSDNTADHAHNATMSLNNCMTRIPGSINSKNGQTVKILQKWDGYRPSIKPLLEDFYIYLSARKIKDLTSQSQKSSWDRSRDESYYENIRRYQRLSHNHY